MASVYKMRDVFGNDIALDEIFDTQTPIITGYDTFNSDGVNNYYTVTSSKTLTIQGGTNVPFYYVAIGGGGGGAALNNNKGGYGGNAGEYKKRNFYFRI